MFFSIALVTATRYPSHCSVDASYSSQPNLHSINDARRSKFVQKFNGMLLQYVNVKPFYSH